MAVDRDGGVERVVDHEGLDHGHFLPDELVVPGFHWIPTGLMIADALAGLAQAAKLRGPHMPGVVHLLAARCDGWAVVGVFTFFSASTTTSNSEYVEPIDWTH